MKINTRIMVLRDKHSKVFLQISYFSFYYFITTVYKHRSLKSLEIVIIYLVPGTVSAVRIEPRKELLLLCSYTISNNFFFCYLIQFKTRVFKTQTFFTSSTAHGSSTTVLKSKTRLFTVGFCQTGWWYKLYRIAILNVFVAT